MNLELEKMIIDRYDNLMKYSNVVGIHYSTIRSILSRDIKKATMKNLMKIANSLDITIEELLALCGVE